MKQGIQLTKVLMSFLFCISIGFAQAVTVEGDLTADATWTSDNTYYLNNQLFVKDGVTLTIEAGTEILGRYDANYSADNPAPCVVVEQGGMIMAEGTVDAPITFRSELDPDDANYGNGRGLWGGLIVNGYAPISNTGGVSNVEGLTSVQYGGTDPNDNSGVLRYVRVWNGGSSIAPDNEINGITLAGVGRGTTVEYCEVALNLDDGFEMFGGTVDLKHCAVFAVGDDAFDTDNGYQGRGQFLLVVRADDSDKAHEMDNATNGDLDSQPRSHPHFANVTVISSPSHGEDGLRLREGTGGDFRNYILHGANDGVRNDENGSEVVTQDLTEAAAAGHPDYLYISGSMVMNGLADVPWDDFDETGDGTWTGTYVSESAGLSISVDADGMPEMLDVTPTLGGIAYEDVDDVIEDDFFEQVNYKGAFGSHNWMEEWSGMMSYVTMLNLEEDSHVISDEISLLGNYPNPFNPSTEIAFELGKSYEIVSLKVFNLMGQTVFETSIKNVRAGNHKITWEGSDMSGAVVPSGLYLYQISTDTRSVIGKMTLLK